MRDRSAGIRACTIARAEGIHLGEARTGGVTRSGLWLTESLCGIHSNALLDIYWQVHPGVTEVTCKTCYDKAKAMHDELG